MWQYPPSNWGKFSFWQEHGRDLSGYKRLSFWARADKETTIEFMVGGTDERYGDTITSPVKEVCRLTNAWTEFTIPLEGDASHVISGFGWASNVDTNPEGVTFYLDDIRFLKDAGTNLAQSVPPNTEGAPHEKYVSAAWAALEKRGFKGVCTMIAGDWY